MKTKLKKVYDAPQLEVAGELYVSEVLCASGSLDSLVEETNDFTWE